MVLWSILIIISSLTTDRWPQIMSADLPCPSAKYLLTNTILVLHSPTTAPLLFLSPSWMSLSCSAVSICSITAHYPFSNSSYSLADIASHPIHDKYEIFRSLCRAKVWLRKCERSEDRSEWGGGYFLVSLDWRMMHTGTLFGLTGMSMSQ